MESAQRQDTIRKSTQYQHQKSEPSLPPKSSNVSDQRTSRYRRLVLTPLSEQHVKGAKSFSVRASKSKIQVKSRENMLNELKIDSKCEGTHLRMKNYSRWFND